MIICIHTCSLSDSLILLFLVSQLVSSEHQQKVSTGQSGPLYWEEVSNLNLCYLRLMIHEKSENYSWLCTCTWWINLLIFIKLFFVFYNNLIIKFITEWISSNKKIIFSVFYISKLWLTRATLSVALYARQMQFTWDQIHYLEVRPYQVNPTSGFQDIAFTSNKLLWWPSWFL